MPLTYDESDVTSLFCRLKYEQVLAKEIVVGDLVMVNDWRVLEVARVDHSPVPEEWRKTPLHWVRAEFMVELFDRSGNSGTVFRAEARLRRIPQAMRKPYVSDGDPDEE